MGHIPMIITAVARAGGGRRDGGKRRAVAGRAGLAGGPASRTGGLGLAAGG
jgi:hypothetical protein